MLFFCFIEICSLIFNKGIWHAAYGRRETAKAKKNTIEKKVKDEKRKAR